VAEEMVEIKDGTMSTMISGSGQEFDEKVTPKTLNAEDLFLFRCPKCKGMHFRHAGYMESMTPYMNPKKEQKVAVDSYAVKVCVKCHRAYIWADTQMYDVTDQIDMEAWEKFEKEAQKATGPGGEC
jgi:predicted nucleic-acid-binding Zn-ribbon protein